MNTNKLSTFSRGLNTFGVSMQPLLVTLLLTCPMQLHKLTAQTKAEVLAWLDAKDGIMPGDVDSIQYTGSAPRSLAHLDVYQNDGQTVKLFVDGQEIVFNDTRFVLQNDFIRIEGLNPGGRDDVYADTDHGDIEGGVPLALSFIGGDINQTREYSDQFRVYFEAVNLVNTGKIHVRASNRIFRPGVDDPKTFGYTLYTIDGPAGGNAPEFIFNSVVNLDMQALQAADHDGDDIRSVNDGTVYITYIEEETGDAGTFNAYPQLDVLKFTYDFSPPKIFPNPVSQSEGIRYEVPSAFQDGCTIELINNSGQTIRIGTHEKGGAGILPLHDRVQGGVYYVRFTSPTGKQETIKVVILG